ncbi:uncharacterized protein METZ01_LOCUS353745 [marine metagenome]|uniref:Uncharacterized protein n=1 Tax=marine metagenome TaxID=408172 RepID=A0A382RW48_9ZZZZ
MITSPMTWLTSAPSFSRSFNRLVSLFSGTDIKIPPEVCGSANNFLSKVVTSDEKSTKCCTDSRLCDVPAG